MARNVSNVTWSNRVPLALAIESNWFGVGKPIDISLDETDANTRDGRSGS